MPTLRPLGSQEGVCEQKGRVDFVCVLSRQAGFLLQGSADRPIGAVTQCWPDTNCPDLGACCKLRPTGHKVQMAPMSWCGLHRVKTEF